MTKLGIVGGGCASLWLGLEAARAGFDTTIIAEDPIAQYASTKNQGWLQSGALYAGLDQIKSALDCRQGFSDLAMYAPDAVNREVPCFFLFERASDRNEFRFKCEVQAIPAIDVPFEYAVQKVPSLARSDYIYPLQVMDCPMDSRRILSRLKQDCDQAGVQFDTGMFPGCDVQQSGSNWDVKDTTTGLNKTFDMVVLACGVYIMDLVEKLYPGLKLFTASKIEVLAVQGFAVGGMLVLPKTDRAPQLVPFKFGSTEGFTVCLARDDVTISNVSDTNPRVDRVKQGVQKLRAFYPDLLKAQAINTFNADIHVCQKLSFTKKTTDRSRIVVALRDHAKSLDGVFALYPGKFTTSRIAARDCLALISGHPTSNVAEQPYANQAPQKTITVNRGKLHLN